MNRILSVALITAILFGAGYWYHRALSGCATPITYRIGSIDERFSIGEDEARSSILAAERLWEDGLGQDLFTYDDAGDVVIDFVYDERQARADEESGLRAVLEDKEGESDSVKAEYELLVSQYESLRLSYEQSVSVYESKLTRYNTEVADWNERGGAPKDVYQRLEETKRSLDNEETKLSSLTSQLNTLARRINTVGGQGNMLISDYNSLVNTYNNEFAEGDEFTQGEYTDDHITIYEFGSTDELSLVVAHEFGHALGLDHVEGSDSIMFRFMDTQKLSNGLTADDIAAFRRYCGEGGGVGMVPERMWESLVSLLPV